jgi:hypothetical protein
MELLMILTHHDGVIIQAGIRFSIRRSYWYAGWAQYGDGLHELLQQRTLRIGPYGAPGSQEGDPSGTYSEELATLHSFASILSRDARVRSLRAPSEAVG